MKANKRHGARTATGVRIVKQFVRGCCFASGLWSVPPEQRTALESATDTPAKIGELYRRANRVGKAPSEMDVRAIQVAEAWLFFYEAPNEIVLAQLMFDSTFRELNVRLTPAEGD
jgi:hypothetical protein